LSDTVQADVPVESPMVVGISAGRESWATAQCFRAGSNNADPPVPYGMIDCFPEGAYENGDPIHDWNASDWAETSITLPVMYTGQDKTFTLYLMSENVADVKVKGHEEIRVAAEGITCEDFKPMLCRFDGNIYDDGGYGTQHTDCADVNDCHNLDDNLIELWSAGDTSSWDAESTEVAQWVITFNDVVGTYTFSYRITPVE
jgi:hypothetical protein